jgi:hypothetical protein
MGRSIHPMGRHRFTAGGGPSSGRVPGLIVGMSLGSAIPRQVGLYQSPPPLQRPASMFHPPAGTVNHRLPRGGEFSTARMGNFQPGLT